MATIEENKNLYVHCAGGYRSVIACSLLKRQGFHQLRNVLRLKAGDHIIALDNSGWEYEVELAEMGRDKVKGKILSKTIEIGRAHV